MKLKRTKIDGIFLIEPQVFVDERGFFGSAWSLQELEAQGSGANFVGGNFSYNNSVGTLRGMHYQAHPHGQGKLVRCTKGAIYDVGIDLRPDSKTFCQWVGAELTAENRLMMYLPGDCAHGYLTLEDDTEVHYLVTHPFHPESGRGVRWDDSAFGVEWPKVPHINLKDRDRTYPDFDQSAL